MAPRVRNLSLLQLHLCLPRLPNPFKIPPPCLLRKSQTRQNLRRPRSEDNVWIALMHIYAIIKPCAYWSFLVFR